MRVIVSRTAVQTKYGVTWTTKILHAAAALGPVVDVSGKSADDIRALIAATPGDEAHVLLGGYDLIPSFSRPNPSYHLSQDDDQTIPTDTPYGATPGSTAEEFVPKRIVARIPDATGPATPADFLKVIGFQTDATSAATPAKRFEECAAEFELATRMVGSAIRGGKQQLVESPPAKLKGPPDVVSGLSGAGRVHVLLHGADFSPDWGFLWGRDEATGTFLKAISAQQIDLCDLRGTVVTFSSCYAAMLDSGTSEASHRNESNQVALACLGHGAKMVIAATRSNWISLSGTGDGLGPGLIAEVWRQLAKGKKVGAALRDARIAFVKKWLEQSGAKERPYILKTALQIQLYGNPEAKL
jgi:hypothetical protein